VGEGEPGDNGGGDGGSSVVVVVVLVDCLIPADVTIAAEPKMWQAKIHCQLDGMGKSTVSVQLVTSICPL
jgi:hypothetical protein